MFYSETRRAAPFGTPIIGSSDGSFTVRDTDPQESSLYYRKKRNPYDNITEDEYITKEEKNAMSFVGMIFNRNGIVGFSDSRNAFVLGNTTKEEIIFSKTQKTHSDLRIGVG